MFYDVQKSITDYKVAEYFVLTVFTCVLVSQYISCLSQVAEVLNMFSFFVQVKLFSYIMWIDMFSYIMWVDKFSYIMWIDKFSCV